jgi:tRNA dimethylallyltransferase
MGASRRDKQKIIVILGPTSSGKSDLAVSFAKKFKGEIISADSRQVYKGMDIGSGKITKKEMMNIPHYLIDVASPKRKFSVSRYKKIAYKKIDEIINKDKTPIICGGTAFYIKVITEGIEIPEVKPDWKLRKKFEKESTDSLYNTLKKIDPERAKTIEKDNPRRLIRALEIRLKSDKLIPKIKKNPKYLPILIGIKKDNLEKIIEDRLNKRFKKGMIKEVENLKKSGLSWKRLESFGLEYKWIAMFLQKKISEKEMKENLLRDIIKFSKKQMAWWKNDKKINWVEDIEKTEKILNEFLK